MRSKLIAISACGMIFAPATAVLAQWTPGAELVGQSAQVETGGISNTVYFDAGGQARIMTQNGTTMPATWSAAGGQLCLNTGAAQECWPYSSPMQANVPVTLTSSCQNVSTWTALSTMPPPMPPMTGERG